LYLLPLLIVELVLDDFEGMRIVFKARSWYLASTSFIGQGI
jgi:hypothetical protein